MQSKKIEQITPIQPTQERKYVITAQAEGDTLLLDVFEAGSWHGRQAINTISGEYMQYSPDDRKWRFKKFGNLLGLNMSLNAWYSSEDATSRTNIDTPDMKKLIKEELNKLTKIPIYYDVFSEINYVETQYSGKKRKRIEDNRVMKVQDKMRLVPDIPEKVKDWIWEREGGEHYELSKTAEGFVRIGFLLKVARDTEILAESGYTTVTEFAKAEFDIDKTMVSRFISITDQPIQQGIFPAVCAGSRGRRQGPQRR